MQWSALQMPSWSSFVPLQVGDSLEFLAELPAATPVEDTTRHLTLISNLATTCSALCRAGQQLCQSLQGALCFCC